MHTVELSIRTGRREEMVDVTAEVQDALRTGGVKNGLCLLYVPHTTAAVTINEAADPSVARDVLTVLERLVPLRGDYTHAEGNADAHAKSVLVGASALVPVSEGRLMLGTWQGIFFCEFDGPRRRRMAVKFVEC